MKTPAKLAKLNPCREALEWLEAGSFEDLQAAWKVCERGDWMLWLIGKLSGKPGSASRKKLVLAACSCARLSLPIFEKQHPKDNRPRNAIETAEAHARGKATLKQVRFAASAAADASDASSAAAYFTSSAAAYSAAACAYSTAYSAYSTTYSAAAATYSAAAATYSAAAATYSAAAAARANTLKSCADIVRKFYPNIPKL